MVKFGVMVQTWISLPTPNFVKIAREDSPHIDKFLPKIPNYDDFGGLKPHCSKFTRN